MGLFTFNIGVNDVKFDEIISLINQLKVLQMTTQAELDQAIADMNAAISKIDTLKGSVEAQITKIFDEIVKSQDASGKLDVSAVLAVRDTLLANVDNMTASVTSGLQKLDDLNPDAPAS